VEHPDRRAAESEDLAADQEAESAPARHSVSRQALQRRLGEAARGKPDLLAAEDLHDGSEAADVIHVGV
jgi:hypothetical protein